MWVYIQQPHPPSTTPAFTNLIQTSQSGVDLLIFLGQGVFALTVTLFLERHGRKVSLAGTNTRMGVDDFELFFIGQLVAKAQVLSKVDKFNIRLVGASSQQAGCKRRSSLKESVNGFNEGLVGSSVELFNGGQHVLWKKKEVEKSLRYTWLFVFYIIPSFPRKHHTYTYTPLNNWILKLRYNHIHRIRPTQHLFIPSYGSFISPPLPSHVCNHCIWTTFFFQCRCVCFCVWTFCT